MTTRVASPELVRPRGRKRLALAAGTLTLVALTGCGGASGGSTSAAPAGGETAYVQAPGTDAGGPAPLITQDKAAAGTADVVVVDTRDVIRTGTVRLRTDQVEQSALAASAAARRLGGLVAAENTITDPSNPDRTVAELTLRVPSARFDDLLAEVRTLGVVLSQTQQAQDVTGQVADVQARVEAQRASVRRIQALLARADTIGEVVTVEAQLAQRQSDLEALEAQQKALADQTTLATVQVSVVGPDPAGTEEDPTGFFAGLDKGWTAFTAALTAGLTALGAIVPFVGFVLVLGLPLLAWSRSRSRRAAEVTPPTMVSDGPPREDVPVG